MSTDRQFVALRGATTVTEDSSEAIVDATVELLTELMAANEVTREDIISILFTCTADLTAEFPAVGARKIGLTDVPLLCAAEIAVPGALPKCIRVLVHLTSPRHYSQLRHVYLREASELRTDLPHAD
jgi:chorismate mutase